jgi:tetratricopeptide (TPR) repeat protein
MRRVNRRFAVLLLAALGLLGVGAYSLHGYQVKRNAGALLSQAERAEAEGQLARSADYLSRYLALAPRDTEALARYGVALEKLATNEKARVQAFLVLERVLLRDPGRRDVRRRLVPLAMAIGRWSDAVGHANALLADDPGDAELLALLGQCEEGAGYPDRARDAYERAIAQAPQELANYLRLAGLLRRALNQPRAADGWIEDMVARNGVSAKAFLMRGAYYKDSRDPAKAADSFARAHSLAPDDAEVLLAMATGPGPDDVEAAREYLERGIDLYPKDTRFYLALARQELRAGRRAEAARRLRDCLKHTSGGEVVWNAADLLLDAGEGDDARELLGRLSKENYPAAPTTFLKGRLLLQDGAWLAAAGCFSRVLPRLADAPELSKRTNLYLGRCYEQLGNPDQALAAYRQAAAADPLWPAARAGVASACLTLGKVEAALEEYRAIQARHPESRLAFARLLTLRNLSLPARERDWAEVEKALDEAAQALPGSVEVLILQAEMLAGQNRLQEAAELLDGVEPARRKQASYWVARAGLTERMGQPEPALRLLDEGEAVLGPDVELRLARARYWSRHPGPAAGPALADLEQQLTEIPADRRARLCEALAEAHNRLGHEQDAERLWAQVARTGGQENGLHVRSLLFDLALRRGDDARLRELIEEIRAIEGADGALWRYAEAARLVRQAGAGDLSALDRPRALLSEVAKLRPAWSRVPLLEAAIAELEGDVEGVIKGYRAAIERGERRPEVVHRVVQLLAERRRFLEADQILRKLPEQGPVSGELAKLAAELSLRRQDGQRALELAQAAVGSESSDYRDHLWVGQVLWAVGRNDEAEGHLRRAVELAEGRPEPWVGLVQFLARVGQIEKAEAALADARVRIEESARAVALAQCYEALGRGGLAEKQYGEALQGRPDDPAVLRTAADFYLRTGRPSAAEAQLRHFLEPAVKASPPDLAWARRSLAFALSAKGDPRERDRALALLEENRRGPAESAEDQRTRALVLALLPGRRAEAVGLFEDLARRQPLGPDERFVLAKLYEAEGNWRLARETFLSLAASSDVQPLHLGHYVNGLLVRGEAGEAQLWLARLEKLEPDSPRTVDLKTRLLHRQGRTDEAVAVVREFARGKDVPPALVAGLFDALGLQAADDAEAAYRRAVDDPGRAENDLLFAGFLARRGRVSEALDWCERAGRDTPGAARAAVGVLRAGRSTDEQVRKVEGWLGQAIAKERSPDLLLALAELRDYQARYDDAMAAYREVLRRDEDNGEALNNLAWMLAVANGNGEEALQAINRAIRKWGSSPNLLDTRAVIYLRQNQPALALEDLDLAPAHGPDASVHFHRAQACLAQGDRAAAAKALRAAKACGLEPATIHPLELSAYRRLLDALGTD